MSFSVEFLGCKISQTDMQGVRERLLAGGLEEAREGGAVHVVNTCCVTHEAVAKSRKAVRSALRRGAGHVYVTGCATRLGADAFGAADGRVTVVRETAEEAAERIARELGATACVGPAPRLDRTRAFVKVQDGCTFGCAFCVIPKVRGASRSRPLRAVLDEARRRIAQGHRELVVTGVNLGLYRDAEARAKLPDVLLALAELDGIARVRLSSIEVNHLSERLCAALAHPRVCPHLHVPLQSGDDGVLRAMRRRYDLATYARRVERARAAVPGLNLTGDVIVGFPAEDGAAFARTLAAVEELGFSRLHVFPYSPRPGRARPADPVPPASSAAAPSACARSPTGSGTRAARRSSASATTCWSSAWTPRRLHGYGADYTAYELRAHAGAGVGDLVEVVLEAPGERAARGGCCDRSHRQGRQDRDEGGRRRAPRRAAPGALALRDAEKDARRPLTDDEVQGVLRRELKRRREAAKAFHDAGHADRAAAEEGEAALIEGYLPAQLSDEDLEVIVESAIAKVGATPQREMGQVMREAMALAAGRADGKRVQERVRARLAG